MQLINTLEISAYQYADKEYEYPDGSSVDFPDEWNDYWLTCISDKGLGNLKAIKKGSYLVDMNSISDPELEIILKQELKEVDPAEFEDQLSCLCGGLVVKDDERFLIEPMCCGDIGNIKNWTELMENEASDWTALWIGHPQVFYRINDGIVEFSDYSDLNAEDLTNLSGIHKISELELQTELRKIMKEQEAFRGRIRLTLEKMGIAQAERIAALMTGNG
jgi:hypothetical protein